MKSTLAITIVLLLVSFIDTCKARQQAVNENILKQSVVKLVTGQSTSYGLIRKQSVGTGFIVHDNYIVTNCHLLENVENLFYESIGIYKSSRPLRLYAADYDSDICLFYSYEKTPYPIIGFYNNKSSEGDRVVVVGYPRGGSLVVTEGNILSKESSDDLEFIIVTNPVEPGSSGSPVFDVNGFLVGVLTATASKYHRENIVVSVKHVNHLLQSVGLDRIKSSWIDNETLKILPFTYRLGVQIGTMKSLYNCTQCRVEVNDRNIRYETIFENMGINYHNNIFRGYNFPDNHYLRHIYNSEILFHDNIIYGYKVKNTESVGVNYLLDISAIVNHIESSSVNYRYESSVDSTSNIINTGLLNKLIEYNYTSQQNIGLSTLDIIVTSNCRTRYNYKRTLRLEYIRSEEINEMRCDNEIVLMLNQESYNYVVD